MYQPPKFVSVWKPSMDPYDRAVRHPIESSKRSSLLHVCKQEHFLAIWGLCNVVQRPGEILHAQKGSALRYMQSHIHVYVIDDLVLFIYNHIFSFCSLWLDLIIQVAAETSDVWSENTQSSKCMQSKFPSEQTSNLSGHSSYRKSISAGHFFIPRHVKQQLRAQNVKYRIYWRR